MGQVRLGTRLHDRRVPVPQRRRLFLQTRLNLGEDDVTMKKNETKMWVNRSIIFYQGWIMHDNATIKEKQDN